MRRIRGVQHIHKHKLTALKLLFDQLNLFSFTATTVFLSTATTGLHVMALTFCLFVCCLKRVLVGHWRDWRDSAGGRERM